MLSACFSSGGAEVRSQNETCDANGNVMRANFVVRASMSNGRYADAYGSCDRGACGGGGGQS